MFIIWGFGKKTFRSYGFLPTSMCGRCNNEVKREINKVTTWFTLFFIPIIPYKKEYYLICPICNGAQSLTRAEFDQLIEGQSVVDEGTESFRTAATYSQGSEEDKYAGKNPTQIAYLKQMEEAENERKVRREQMESEGRNS